MSEPRIPFSVVIPLFNKEATIERALRSVFNQTVQDFEIIIINDGSTDNSASVVAAIADPRMRLVHQENRGVSAARNRGIEEARYELIAFLDADDEWEITFLATISHLRKKYPTCKVFATNYRYREMGGSDRLPIIRGLPSLPWEGILDDYFGIAAKSDPPLWSSAVAVTKEAIQTVGMFPVGVSSGEDLLTWARLYTNFNIAYSTKCCAIFYVPMNVFERPERFRDKNIVSQELLILLNKVDSARKDDLKKYIGIYHKNRAVTLIALGRFQQAHEELQYSSSFLGKNIKWYIYYIICLLPQKIGQLLYKLVKKINLMRRNSMSSHNSIEG